MSAEREPWLAIDPLVAIVTALLPRWGPRRPWAGV